DQLRTLGPRRDSYAQGAGVCPSGAGARLQARSRYCAALTAESSSSRAYPSHLWIGGSDYRRRQPELLGIGSRTANAILGIDVERWETVSTGRAQPDYLPWDGNHDHGLWAQPGR